MRIAVERQTDGAMRLMLSRSGRGYGTGGAWGAIAPPIFLEIGKLLVFSTPNIS